MTSYLTESTEIRKLQEALAEKEKSLAESTSKLSEAVKIGEVATRKIKLAEDRAQRTKVMGELLSNLRGDKRAIMEGMLETVKTDQLRTSFDKLLPVVLDETARKAPPAKKVLTEQAAPAKRKPATVVTGDQRTNRLAEAAEAEAMELDPDIAQVIRLAGIKS